MTSKFFTFTCCFVLFITPSLAFTQYAPNKRSVDDQTSNVLITCGIQAGGQMCPGSLCCSQYGYCGSGTEYCGSGCQSTAGTCITYEMTSSNQISFDGRCGALFNDTSCGTLGNVCNEYGYCADTKGTVIIPPKPTPLTGDNLTTQDGQCGMQNGGKMCTSQFGTCCGYYGWCGSTDEYCGQGCQSGSCTKTTST